MTEPARCDWAGTDPLYVAYHDEEWGVPVHDDKVLFEFLILEGAQAGLSWITILKKRAQYQKVYSGFDPALVARFTPAKRERLLQDAGIVRNRLKVEASVQNAKSFLAVQDEFGSFDDYIWRFVDNEPQRNRWRTMDEVPAKTEISDSMCKDLKQRGFKFVGSTICYAYMQSIGMVDDHIARCYLRSAN